MKFILFLLFRCVFALIGEKLEHKLTTQCERKRERERCSNRLTHFCLKYGYTSICCGKPMNIIK